jgi:hypothetical protein
MKKILMGIFLVILIFTYTNSFAYSYCNNIAVTKVESASGSGFHNMSELGVVGTFVFVRLDTTKCGDSQGTPFASTVFLVIDDLDNSTAPNTIKKTWITMLMTAATAGKTINFHASNLGINSRNMQALRPYYLTLN